ncbi:MAG: hypothetical protein KF696_11015 [Planctomycetes bacterium]|nr:hypothetical protein [Planctomycetota bacterium]MCW8135818.1 hypothetical protein [Planctomycetota bacterium]
MDALDLDIELSDADNPGGNQVVSVTNVSVVPSAPTGVTAPSAQIGSAGATLTISWTGTINASNAPGNYDYTIDFEDDEGTPNTNTIVVRLILTNVAPVAVQGAAATAGDGSAGDPFRGANQTKGTTPSLALANVTDANTGQTLSMGTVTPGGTNPSAAFTITANTPGAGGTLTLTAVAGGALASADLGTHNFAVQVLVDAAPAITVNLRVVVVNGVPVLGAPNVSGGDISLGGSDPAFTGTLLVGQSLNVSFTATDSDTGDTLTVTATRTGGSLATPAAAGFTGTFPATAVGTTPRTLNLTGTAAAAGTITLTIDVGDGDGGTDSYTLAITITTAPTITVTAPNGGENITIGNNFNITWTSAGAGATVEIHLSIDGGGSFPTVITASTANNGSFSWNTTGAPATTQARIRIRDTGTPTTLDTSNANFTLAVPAPAGGSLSASNNPGSRNVSPGSSASALGFRVSETGGSSTLTITQVIVEISLLNNTGGVGAAAITSVSLRRGSSTLATINNGGGGWSATATTLTLTYSGLSAAISGGANADFSVVISFSSATPPSPSPGYIASVDAADISANGSIAGTTVTGGTITLVEDLPDDPFAEDKEDSCELSTRGGPAWPALLLFVGLLAAAYRVRRARE